MTGTADTPTICRVIAGAAGTDFDDVINLDGDAGARWPHYLTHSAVSFEDLSAQLGETSRAGGPARFGTRT